MSHIRAESAPLRGLVQVNQDLVQELGRRCADQKIATIDLDGTIIESGKKQAQKSYEGPSGYQPLLALRAEMNVVVADEFLDGNVARATGATAGDAAGLSGLAVDGGGALVSGRCG